MEGIWNATGKGIILLGEGFNFETLKSSSVETEKKVGEKRVQLQNNKRVMM
jgi:hypothetical protein